MKRFLAVILIAALALALCACGAEKKPAPTGDSAGVMAATFEGMADGHTIEVVMGGEAVSLQLEGEALTQAESFEKGDKVYVRYERHDGVLYALAIELAAPAQ